MSEDKDFIQIEKSTRRKPGRPKGSANLNTQFKRNQREQEKARKVLWQKGELSWKLDTNQLELREMYYNHGKWTTLPFLYARQIGKSYCVTTIICEEAQRQPGIIMAYIAPKLNQAKRIVSAKMREILVDCPDNLRPTFNSQDNVWRWSNGSELYLAGTDNGNAESIRGMTLNRVFIDEFCFLTDFEYVMNSIIFPTMMSVPDPLMVLISSPPKTCDHESNEWLDEAETDGRLTVKTIYDCPRHSKEKIERIIKEQYHGDVNSIDFRREMLCERIADSSMLVLPEAARDGKLEHIVAEFQRPEFYNVIEAFDWGAADRNAGLFGYIDFDSQVLVIENEMFLDIIEHNTAQIADEIRKTETGTWGYSDNLNLLRYGDNNNKQLLIDMNTMYNLCIIATRKDGLIAAVNHVRNLIKNDQILIHPRCVNLIEQIQSATWQNTSRKKFSKKTGKDAYGKNAGHHYDLVAALVYLVRNANMQVNPYPTNYAYRDRPKQGFINYGRERDVNNTNDKLVKHLKDTFTIKKKKRN